WTLLAKLPANTTEYTVEGLDPNTAYQFKVRPVGVDGPGSDSEMITVKTHSIPVIVEIKPPSKDGNDEFIVVVVEGEGFGVHMLETADELQHWSPAQNATVSQIEQSGQTPRFE